MKEAQTALDAKAEAEQALHDEVRQDEGDGVAATRSFALTNTLLSPHRYFSTPAPFLCCHRSCFVHRRAGG